MAKLSVEPAALPDVPSNLEIQWQVNQSDHSKFKIEKSEKDNLKRKGDQWEKKLLSISENSLQDHNENPTNFIGRKNKIKRKLKKSNYPMSLFGRSQIVSNLTN